MKKKLISLLALMLALLLLLPACSTRGETLIEAGKEEISIGVFALYLARMKYSLSLVDNINAKGYWEKIATLDGVTQAEHYTDQVFEGLKYVAAGLILYEKMGLELDREVERAIDDEIDELIELVGDGSKAEFNSILSEYMVNITMLREAWILAAKIDQLKTELYGEGGSKILDNVKEDFYQLSYRRAKVLHIANYYHKHDKDDDGRSVYYLLDKNGNIDLTKIAYDTAKEKTGELDKHGAEIYREEGGIAYDTKNGLPSEDEKRDAKGDLIYYDEDGKILYDTEKGKPTEEKDENGNTIYRKWVIAYNEDEKVSDLNYHYDEKDGQKVNKIEYYTTDEMAKRLIAANKIAAECSGKSEEYFDQVALEYDDSRDYFESVAPNGIYFAEGSTTTDAFFAGCAAELQKLDEGDTVVMEADGGIFVMMRCKLDAGAWGKAENAVWFSTLSSLVIDYLFQQEVAPYVSELVIHEDVKRSIDITMMSPTNYY